MESRKDYLTWENGRNHRAKKLYTDIMHEAFGASEGIVIGHHLTFDEDDPDEIPSADTLIFDHTVARKIWGSGYLDVLRQLAQVPCELRDDLLGTLYYGREMVSGATA